LVSINFTCLFQLLEEPQAVYNFGYTFIVQRGASNMEPQIRVREFVDYYLKDEIAQTLLKNSFLTETQFETILINESFRVLTENQATTSEKAKIRNTYVSRASFSRTLSQARRNLVKSFMTILLLRYVGIIQDEVFDAFDQLGEQLRQLQDLSDAEVQGLETELIAVINELSKPTSIKTL